MMSLLINKAKSIGSLFALDESYLDMFPNSPYWNPGDLALNPDGTPKLGWLNDSGVCSSPQAYHIAPDKMVFYANQESPKIKADYQTTAAYLDITTSFPLQYMIDYSATNPESQTHQQVYDHALKLHQNARLVYQGPLAGEGSQIQPGSPMLFYAGRAVDAVEGEIVGKESASVMPDFWLRQVQPVLVGQGMGYYPRWTNTPGGPTGVWIAPLTFDWDKYDATAMAFGRAGLMNESFGSGSPSELMQAYLKFFTKTYYLFRALQEQYLAAAVQTIRYRDPSGQLVDLLHALEEGVDFGNAQLEITYDNGLALFVNRHATNTWTVTVGANAYYLPPNGWLAVNEPTGFFEASHLVDANDKPDLSGHRVDEVRSGDYIFVDGRGTQTSFGVDYAGAPIVSSLITVVKPTGWTVAEQPDGTFQSPLPQAPSLLSVYNWLGLGDIRLYIKDNSPNETSFVVERSSVSPFAGFTPIATGLPALQGTGGSFVYHDTTLNMSVSNYYRVYAVNASGPSAYSNISGFTPPPTQLKAVAVSPTQVNLSWVNPAVFLPTYLQVSRVLVSPPHTTTYYQLPPSATSYSDTSVVGNTLYEYWVSVIDAFGSSGNSYQVIVQTP